MQKLPPETTRLTEAAKELGCRSPEETFLPLKCVGTTFLTRRKISKSLLFVNSEARFEIGLAHSPEGEKAVNCLGDPFMNCQAALHRFRLSGTDPFPNGDRTFAQIVKVTHQRTVLKCQVVVTRPLEILIAHNGANDGVGGPGLAEEIIKILVAHYGAVKASIGQSLAGGIVGILITHDW